MEAPFTPEQIERLREIAEQRDVQRGRGSRFSHGEQNELDETADKLRYEQSERATLLRNEQIDKADRLKWETKYRAAHLGFNEKQQEELTHRFRRRWLPIVAYLILAAASAYSVATSRSASFQHANHNRAQVTEVTRRITYDNCQANNDTRRIIRVIIQTSIPTTEKFVREHTLTQAQANRSVAASREAIKSLANRNCQNLVNALH